MKYDLKRLPYKSVLATVFGLAVLALVLIVTYQEPNHPFFRFLVTLATVQGVGIVLRCLQMDLDEHCRDDQ